MEEREFKFRLGQTLKDGITGLEGVAVAKTQWISGCARYALQPRGLKDGKPIDEQWFDEERLEPVPEAKKEAVGRPGGGPQKDPVQPTGSRF